MKNKRLSNLFIPGKKAEKWEHISVSTLYSGTTLSMIPLEQNASYWLLFYNICFGG